MKSLRSIRFCLLALTLALVQLWIPLSAYARMANNGSLMQDVCSTSGRVQMAVPLPDAADPSQGHEHDCSLCTASAVLVNADIIASLPHGAPQSFIRLGSHSPRPPSLSQTPPATGPPTQV